MQQLCILYNVLYYIRIRLLLSSVIIGGVIGAYSDTMHQILGYITIASLLILKCSNAQLINYNESDEDVTATEVPANSNNGSVWGGLFSSLFSSLSKNDSTPTPEKGSWLDNNNSESDEDVMTTTTGAPISNNNSSSNGSVWDSIVSLFSSTSNNDSNSTSEKGSSWLDEFWDSLGPLGDTSSALVQSLLPSDYSKHSIPVEGDSDNSSLLVRVGLLIHEVVDVDIKNERVILDVDYDMAWRDYKVRDKMLRQERWTTLQSKVLSRNDSFVYGTSIDPEFLKHIWKPDVSFQDLAEENRAHSLTEKIQLLLMVGDNETIGNFELLARSTLNLKCDMNFVYYPADTPECTFNLGSYRYTSNLLKLAWGTLKKRGFRQTVFLQTSNDSNFDYQVYDVEPGNELLNYQLSYNWGTNYSALTFGLKIRRNLTYHLVQTYLPSVLLILITWLCFLLPPDMVEARVGIAMTTVLALTAMFSSIREKSPEVSYTMAIDIWMVFCIFLVFLALVLFTLVYWLRRKSLQHIRDANLNLEPNPSGHTASVSSRRTKSFKFRIEQEGLADVDSKKVEYFQLLAAGITKYAFSLFAVLFLTFLGAYTTWLIVCSKYLDWDPSLVYNAMESGGAYRYDSEKIQET